MTWVLAQGSDVLPDDNTGYVAAAYLVFFALVLVYFAIMAAKLQRLERELVELNELAARNEVAPKAAAAQPPVAEPAP